MNKAGRPPRTTCRYCGEGGELLNGAHRACRNEYIRRIKAEERRVEAEKRGPKKCSRCGIVIPEKNSFCTDCRDENRRENHRRYEAKRPKKPRAPKPPAERKPKPITFYAQAKKSTKPRKPDQIVISMKQAPESGIVLNPNNIQPRRIDPVGPARLSFEEYRRA